MSEQMKSFEEAIEAAAAGMAELAAALGAQIHKSAMRGTCADYDWWKECGNLALAYGTAGPHLRALVTNDPTLCGGHRTIPFEARAARWGGR